MFYIEVNICRLGRYWFQAPGGCISCRVMYIELKIGGRGPTPSISQMCYLKCFMPHGLCHLLHIQICCNVAELLVIIEVCCIIINTE
jgi:hypothetical protein